MQPLKLPQDFSLLLDGRLDAESAAALRAHIAADPELSEQFERFEQVRNTLRMSAALAELPRGFDEGLRKRLHNAEIERRAQERAFRELGRQTWWGRAAGVISGVAAGIAVMLALHAGGILGGDEGTQLPRGITAIGPGDAALSFEEVAPLITPKRLAYQDLQRQLTLSNSVHPEWLQFEAAALLESNGGLLNVLRTSHDNRSEEYVVFIESLNRACGKLQTLAQNARRDNRDLQTGEVLGILRNVRAPRTMTATALILEPQETIDGFSRSITPDRDEAKQEFSQYARARYHYLRGEYRKAADGFVAFVTQHPQSRYFDLAAAFAAKAKMRSGDAAGALELMESISRIRPQVLRLLSSDEVTRMVRRYSVERKQVRIVVTQTEEGSMRLEVQEVENRKPEDKEVASALHFLNQRRDSDAIDIDVDDFVGRWKTARQDNSSEPGSARDK